ncbi:hypothetical protein RI367_007897 [Sorochytrium milnesiophthora]
MFRRKKKPASIQLIPKYNRPSALPVVIRKADDDNDDGNTGESKVDTTAVTDAAGSTTLRRDSDDLPILATEEHPSLSSPRAHSPSDMENITETRGLGRFRNDPVRFMIRLTAEGSAFARGSGWRRYSNFVGAPILYADYWKDMYKAVLSGGKVPAMVKSMAQQQYDAQVSGKGKSAKKSYEQIEKETWHKVNGYLNALMADMSSRASLRFTAFVVNNLLVRLYHQGIYIKGAEFLKLRQAALEAQEKGISLIFLPCHKSHVDYLVISYVFFRLGIALPHIAAGQNLNLPVVGPLLRKGGAFFIRRTFGDDPVYNTVFKEYIEALLKKGHNIEAFIEGTRSRTGKLLTPKFGILKIVLEAVTSGRVKDAYIVPMSIGYDKACTILQFRALRELLTLQNKESYVNELLGTEKQPESLEQLMNSTSVFQWKWGRIDVRFQDAWSLKDFISSEQQVRSPFSLDVPGNFNTLLRALGYRVLSHINDVSVVMPTALVGTIILTSRGRGVSRDQLARSVDWLRTEILLKGGRVAEFGDATDVIVDRVLAILGVDLIGERKELMVPVYYVKKRFELSFYRNQVIHLFIQESIVCCSFYANLKYSTGPVARQKLLEDVTFLSQIMKREFIYPRGEVAHNMDIAVQQLTARSVLVCDPGSGDIDLSYTTRMTDREKFEFYCFLLWPFIETYWLSAVSLIMLLPEPTSPAGEGGPQQQHRQLRWFDEKRFVDAVQQLGKTLYYEGELNYFESINKETLKNALFFLEEQQFIVRRSGAIAVRLEKYPDFLVPGPPATETTSAPLPLPAEMRQQQQPALAPCNSPPGGAGAHITLVDLVHRLQDYRRDRDSVGLLHHVDQETAVRLNVRVLALVWQGRTTLRATAEVTLASDGDAAASAGEAPAKSKL